VRGRGKVTRDFLIKGLQTVKYCTSPILEVDFMERVERMKNIHGIRKSKDLWYIVHLILLLQHFTRGYKT
jgi:hypothetical protein